VKRACIDDGGDQAGPERYCDHCIHHPFATAGVWPRAAVAIDVVVVKIIRSVITLLFIVNLVVMRTFWRHHFLLGGQESCIGCCSRKLGFRWGAWDRRAVVGWDSGSGAEAMGDGDFWISLGLDGHGDVVRWTAKRSSKL